jgi:hypothetical protein
MSDQRAREDVSGEGAGNYTRGRVCSPRICYGFEGLYSYLIGNVMFERSVKPNQTKSSQIKPVNIIASREAAGGAALAGRAGEGLGLRRFDQMLLHW